MSDAQSYLILGLVSSSVLKWPVYFGNTGELIFAARERASLFSQKYQVVRLEKFPSDLAQNTFFLSRDD